VHGLHPLPGTPELKGYLAFYWETAGCPVFLRRVLF